MDLELYPKNNAPQIEGYGKDYIKISGNQIYSTVLLKPDKLSDETWLVFIPKVTPALKF